MRLNSSATRQNDNSKSDLKMYNIEWKLYFILVNLSWPQSGEGFEIIRVNSRANQIRNVFEHEPANLEW